VDSIQRTFIAIQIQIPIPLRQNLPGKCLPANPIAPSSRQWQWQRWRGGRGGHTATKSVIDGRGLISKNHKSQMTSTEQRMRLEVNPLPGEVSDSIRASFHLTLGEFCIRKREHVKLHPSVDRKIKSQVDPTLN
jgi:hypothetical protein